MRVIAGTAKGHRLATPRNAKGIRPVEDRIKEAMFNVLFDVHSARVLDCFAGTGAVGIEALSRGAEHAHFIDNGRVALRLIAENLQRCRLDERATIIAQSYELALAQLSKRQAQYDLLFVDPPYRQNLVQPALQLIADGKLAAAGARLVIEHDQDDHFDIPKPLRLTDQRKYGQTVLTFCTMDS